jgi:hypothetical protein
MLLCLTVAPTSAAAAPIQDAQIVSAAPAPGVVVGFFNDIIGNRTRMIQVACVIVAIGVFVLTRSYR